MLLQQGQELFVKCHVPMMFGLTMDIFADFFELRNAHTKFGTCQDEMGFPGIEMPGLNQSSLRDSFHPALHLTIHRFVSSVPL